MFGVVVFEDDDPAKESVEAVPLSWITPRKKHCYWPSCSSTFAITKAARLCEIPDETWKLYSVRILKTTGTVMHTLL